jgi:TetR/AcrR family transcriptional repressor of nem operon
MPYSPDHKRHTRQKILQSARRLFSAHGFEAASIEEIMFECDLTRGAFYAHFRSKGHLYQEAMGSIAPWYGSPGPGTGETCDRWLDAMLEFCLQPSDASALRETEWTFLAIDAASKQPEVRAAYTCAFKAMSQRLNHEMVQSSGSGRSSLAAMAMIVGTLAVAMTVDDMSLRDSLVNACREHAKALFDDRDKDDRLSFFWTADASDNHLELAVTVMVH